MHSAYLLCANCMDVGTSPQTDSQIICTFLRLTSILYYKLPLSHASSSWHLTKLYGFCHPIPVFSHLPQIHGGVYLPRRHHSHSATSKPSRFWLGGRNVWRYMGEFHVSRIDFDISYHLVWILSRTTPKFETKPCGDALVTIVDIYFTLTHFYDPVYSSRVTFFVLLLMHFVERGKLFLKQARESSLELRSWGANNDVGKKRLQNHPTNVPFNKGNNSLTSNTCTLHKEGDKHETNDLSSCSRNEGKSALEIHTWVTLVIVSERAKNASSPFYTHAPK